MNYGTRARHFRFLAAVFVLLATLLAACGGKGSNSPAASNEAAPPDQQVLRVRLVGEPKTLDPALAHFDTEISVAQQLFTSLFRFDENLDVVPAVAADLPSTENGGISKDGLTYTIKLNKDAKWSDGTPLTAGDFVYGVKRMLDPRLAAPYASFYYSIDGASAYHGALGTPDQPRSPSDADLDRMRDSVGVSAKDASTVVFNLAAPDSSFLFKLALWPAAPIRQDLVAKYGDKWTEPGNMIGNGPFVLKEWVHQDHISFDANSNWVGGKVILQRLIFREIEDDNTAYAAYVNNEIDWMRNIPLANVREVTSPSSSLYSETVRKPELGTQALEFNNKEKPFDNPLVRKAFGTAIDRKAFVDGLLQGVGVAGTEWVPPGMPGYDKDVGKAYEFSPDKARQLLAQAGYPNGEGLPKVTFMTRANDTNRLVAQFLQDQFKKNLNVDIDVDFVDSKTYNARYGKSQFSLILSGWGADWPFPDNFLASQFVTGGGNNQFQYSNPKVDELIKQAVATPDAKKSLDLFQQAQRAIIDDDAAVVPVYHREILLLVKPRVKGYAVTGMDHNTRGDNFFWKTYIAK